ncbi:hypothetical protein [Terrisporobacter mayombei]|uniref:Uncharacterized protein n=1 Tax=Terrisporobacter mayombei TaxID=1541 RepID=A0ABY9Q0W3_9FIRM|nr:hypothetical protein [Terrisporobacter mayombei]MCC3866809.1 hypothetical protein [Terrisporobacter mayombei]WMT81049.1 hypothetical protein TEMA_13810 [Terrisporobacter mayombei]
MSSEIRAMAIKGLIKSGVNLKQLRKHDRGREFILPFLEMQLIFENTDNEFGYPILNGRQINMNSLKGYRVKRDDLIVLAIDGYPKLFPTLEESEIYLKNIIWKTKCVFYIIIEKT